MTGATGVGTQQLAVSGSIEFRGETRPVEGRLTVSADGDRVVVEGAERFDLREWGLRLPRIGLLRVHPHVLVRIRVVAHREGRDQT